MGLFVFLLGAVSSLAIAFILLVNFLNKVEETVQKEYDDTKKAIEDATKEITPTAASTPAGSGAPTTPAGISVGTSLSTGMKLPIKVEAKGSADVPEWVFGIVRANMLFLFKSEFDVSASGVVCLDGCQVSIVKKNSEQSSPWHKNNPVQILGERNLLYQSNTLLMFCKSARDAEMWYYAIFNGAHLSSKKDPTSEQRTKKEHNHFRFLHTILKTSSDTKSSSSPATSPSSSPLNSSSHSSSSSSSSSSSANGPTFTRSLSGTSISHTNPPTSSTHELNSHVHSHLTWLNALLSRIFWNIHDAPDFSAYLTRKFNKKLLKIKKPSILKTVAICNVTFGPNLPMLTSAQMDHLGTSGDVMISGELSYHGGFTLTVAIEIALEVMGRSLSVPVTVTAKVTRLHGRAVAVIPAPPSERVWFAFEREPSCDIDIDTAFGNAGKVANIPRVAKIAVNALKTELLKIIVLPNMEDFQLPKFKGQKGDKGVVNQPAPAHPPTTTTTPTSSIPPSSIPSSTPLPTPSSTPLSTHSQAVPTLTKGGSPSNSVNQFDHKMIDEALEKLASKAHP